MAGNSHGVLFVYDWILVLHVDTLGLGCGRGDDELLRGCCYGNSRIVYSDGNVVGIETDASSSLLLRSGIGQSQSHVTDDLQRVNHAITDVMSDLTLAAADSSSLAC